MSVFKDAQNQVIPALGDLPRKYRVASDLHANTVLRVASDLHANTVLRVASDLHAYHGVSTLDLRRISLFS